MASPLSDHRIAGGEGMSVEKELANCYRRIYLLEEALRDSCRIIKDLADQQAMPDNWWEEKVSNIKEFLGES